MIIVTDELIFCDTVDDESVKVGTTVMAPVVFICKSNKNAFYGQWRMQTSSVMSLNPEEKKVFVCEKVGLSRRGLRLQ